MIKTVWLCHFSNKQIIKRFNVTNIIEFAPWISILIEDAKNVEEINLHIIAPNIFNNTDTCFELDGVSYYFFKYSPIPANNKYFRKLHSVLQLESLTNFLWTKQKIRNIVKKIKPDIIHLHGVENPYYSASIFQFFQKTPTLVTIQGFFGNQKNSESFVNRKRLIIEEKILSQAPNIGIRASFMKDYIHYYNTHCKYFWIQYPYAETKIISIPQKDKDLVFFGRITYNKGIEDLISAIGLLKSKKITRTLRVIGSVSKKYHKHLNKLASSMYISENIEFINYVNSQEELHNLVSKSKICVSPTYNDIYSGTIVESMYLKIPVIAYKIPGLLDLEDPSNISILFVEKGNIQSLADSIELLLADKSLQFQIAENGYLRVSSLFNRKEIMSNLLFSYKEILKEFKLKNSPTLMYPQ